MSVKEQLAVAVTELPENLSLEEAIARLYRAFKLKQMQGGAVRRPLAELSRTLQIHEDILAPALDPDAWDILR